MVPIEKTHWLAHRWAIELDTQPYGQLTAHVGRIEGHRVGQHASRAEYDAWLAAMRPLCLARFVAGRPRLHPATALIVAGEYRLGRIPPELWCGYDVIELLDLPDMTLLSAKVRAMYPSWTNAMIRVVRRGEVGPLHLKPAPNATGARLTLVA